MLKFHFYLKIKPDDKSQKDVKQEQKFDTVCISFHFMHIHLSNLRRTYELIPIFENQNDVDVLIHESTFEIDLEMTSPSNKNPTQLETNINRNITLSW
ncbi:unnamed protein product [Rotaria sp. Silwood1]|nr:unnamed protein product [Rotaria sp. Silwood1]